MRVHGFPPIVPGTPRNARILILGSMPGRASLAANQYYAHPRNLFWSLLGDMLGFDPTSSYRERKAALRRAGLALWDVLQACTRASSLDSDIVEDSIVVNDFVPFLARYPGLERIVFNGAKAEHSFRRYVLPDLPDPSRYDLLRVPSTSPANASIPLSKKRASWKRALQL